MTCPRCGGSDRSAISPGYWECRTIVQWHAPERTAGGEAIVPHSAVCGERYQEGPGVAVEQCSCGTFAIGSCQACGTWVCGDHSGTWAGSRLCSSCYAAEKQASEDAAAAERGRAAANRKQRADAAITAEESARVSALRLIDRLNAAGAPGAVRLWKSMRRWYHLPAYRAWVVNRRSGTVPDERRGSVAYSMVDYISTSGERLTGHTTDRKTVHAAHDSFSWRSVDSALRRVATEHGISVD